MLVTFSLCYIFEELDAKQIKQLKIPIGHQLKIIKKLTPQPVYEELPPPPSFSPSKEGGGALLKGNYDEEESRASFQEALNQFRNKNIENKENEKNDKFQKYDKNQKITNFLKKNEANEKIINTFNIKNDNEKKMGNFTSFEEGTEMSPRSTHEGKISCWQCFKLFKIEEKREKFEKNFCSENCTLIFEKNSIVIIKHLFKKKITKISICCLYFLN